MSIVHTDQRRPFVIDSSGDTDALSSRLYKRIARNANNLISYVCRPPIIQQHWPGGVAVGGTGGDVYVAQWPERVFPGWYNSLRFVVGAVQTVGTGAGAQTVTVRMRVYSTLYRGGGDEGFLIGSGLVTVNQGTGNGHRHLAGAVSVQTRVAHTGYCVLWAEANDGLAAATIFTVKAWLRPSS